MASSHFQSVVRWAARAMSLGVALVLTLFLPGEQGHPSMQDWLLIAFFPLGVVAGLAVAWRWELVGGLISLASLSVFIVLIASLRGLSSGLWIFAAFAVPGILFVMAGSSRRAACGTQRRAFT